MNDDTRYFYTNTANASIGAYPNFGGFVSAKFKGTATAPNGRRLTFVVFGLSINFSAEDGSGIQTSLETQWHYKVRSISKMTHSEYKPGVAPLPHTVRELNYTVDE